MKKLTVLIPARNEEQRIENTLRDVDKYLKNQSYDSEIIVVDNKSTDSTPEIIDNLARNEIKNLRMVLGYIPGKGGAVKVGVAAAEGEYLMFMDADGATPITEMEKFWPVLNSGAEVVIGSRYLDSTHKAKQPWYRTILSNGSRLLVKIVLWLPVSDTQAGFKTFKTVAAKRIFEKVTINGWAFDMELLLIADQMGYKIKEVSIIREDLLGSTVPASAFIESLRDLFKIKLNEIRGIYRN